MQEAHGIKVKYELVWGPLLRVSPLPDVWAGYKERRVEHKYVELGLHGNRPALYPPA